MILFATKYALKDLVHTVVLPQVQLQRNMENKYWMKSLETSDLVPTFINVVQSFSN